MPVLVPGRFDRRVALVTGAGRGIGRAEALMLAKHGAAVVVNDYGGSPQGAGSDPSVASKVSDEIKAMHGEAIAVASDISTMSGARDAVEAALDHFGRIDILINNAGIVVPRPIYDMTERDWDEVVDVSLKGTFATVHHASRHLREQKSGVIVNTSSHSGLGHFWMSNYSAAKEGVVGFTRSVARDLGPYNVRCNAIRPGANTRISIPEVLETISVAQDQFGFPAIGFDWIAPPTDSTDVLQFDHIGTPEQASALAVWLCSDATCNVNGRTFFVLGEKIGLFSDPEEIRSAHRSGGWDLDALDDAAVRSYLLGGLSNRFAPR